MERVVILGSGNVATHLAICLNEFCDIIQVFSRNISNANKLAGQLRCATAICDTSDIASDADIYIVSVSDDAIKNIVEKTTSQGLWLHTSGSTPIGIFKGLKKSYGVLYPLQTFSRNTTINMSEVPLFIEGDSNKTTNAINEFAKKISTKTYIAASENRQQLHIAAVFACNFANHLWAISDEILKQSGYNFSVLIPLLRTTLEKAETISPEEGQTGPARRGDQCIINSHISMLDNHKAEIYKILSKSIVDHYNNAILSNEQN